MVFEQVAMAGEMNNLELISCFCGHIFTSTVKNDTDKNESTIEIKEHKFNSITDAFTVTNQTISFIAQGCLRAVALEICLDKRLGLYKLRILLISYPNFTIGNIDRVSKFKTVANYDLSNIAGDFKSVLKFFLVDSNTVCFNLGANKIVVLHDGSVRTYSTEVQFIVLDCRTVADFLVLIGKTSEGDVSVLTLYTSLSSHGKLHKCDSRLVPDFYASVLTFLKIVDLGLAVDVDSHDPQFVGSALACTSYGQLIDCRSGQLCGCTDLPFCDGCDIRLFNSPSDQFERSLVVVLSAARSCCVVDLKTSQVVFILEDVESVLIGDMVGRGADQILFLPQETRHQSNIDVVSMVDEASEIDLNSGFLLTDLAGIHVDKWTSMQERKEPLKNSKSIASRQAAVEALDSRLLAYRAMVNEANRSCLRKLTVIQETSEALRRMTLGETMVPRSRSTLVPLTGNQTIGNQSRDAPITRAAEAEGVTAGAIWQRIVDRKLVIGVDVHNATDSSIHSVELLLFNSSEQLDSTSSRCLRVESSPLTDAHPTKRPRTEQSSHEQYISSTIIKDVETIPTKGNGTVLVYCELPLFQPEESVTFKAVLAWRKMEGRGGGDSGSLRMVRLSRAVGEVTVDVENVVGGMWNVLIGEPRGEGRSGDVGKDAVVIATDSSDLLSLHCIQMGVRLTMSSATVAFSHRFLSSLQSDRMRFSYVARYECFICNVENYPLFLSRMRILRIRSDEIVVEGFVRDLTQWTILLQTLFKLLPSDVTIALDATKESTHLAESVALSLRQELLFADRREPALSFVDSRETDESVRALADTRSDLESRRKRFLDRTLVDDIRYPLKVIELKQNTDEMIVTLTQGMVCG